MAIADLPPVAVVRQLIRVEPDTGKLFWLPRGEEWFWDSKKQIKAATRATLWNKRYAGTEALASVDNGYRRGNLLGCPVRAHRVVWCLVHGEWPTMMLDHINGDPLDNRISNLREVSNADNTRNAKIRVDNTSGVQGVGWVRRDKRWHARIGSTSLGYFRAKDDAIAARRRAEVEYGYHENHGRA